MTPRMTLVAALAVSLGGVLALRDTARGQPAARWITLGVNQGLEFSGGRVWMALRHQRHDVVEQLARNEHPVAMTVTFAIATENLAVERPYETTVVLPAATREGPRTVVLARFRRADRRRSWHAAIQWRGRFGDAAARPSPYVYALPYPRGARHSLIQGFGGGFSHTGELRHGLDFDLPEGATVTAMREGTVVAFNDAASTHGLTEQHRQYAGMNWVFVLHDDGTLGRYLHLSPRGVRVAVGQRVRRGDPLGLSGFTGYATLAHLHVDVSVPVNGDEVRTAPIVLRLRPGDPGSVPTERASYAAFE